MSTPSGSPKNQVAVVILKEGTRYVAAGNIVERIGHRTNKNVNWVFRNQTQDPLRVTIQNFRLGGTVPPCPVSGADFSSCTASVDLSPAGGVRQVHAKLVGDAGAYTYEIFARNRDTGTGNPIDPELQIDGASAADYLASPVVLAVVAVVLAALAWWALS